MEKKLDLVTEPTCTETSTANPEIAKTTKIVYKSVTGTYTVDVELDERIELVIEEYERKDASNERYRRNHPMLALEEQLDSKMSGDSVESTVLQKILIEDIFENGISELTETQRQRFLMYCDGYKVAEIAKILGISHMSAQESIESAIKKLKKIFKNTLNFAP